MGCGSEFELKFKMFESIFSFDLYHYIIIEISAQTILGSLPLNIVLPWLNCTN
jgi:hypothetical protein